MNYYERHIGDYLKDTSHLSLLEHGVYCRLIDVYYTRESPIPAEQAHRLVGAKSRDERAAVDAVLVEFFKLTDGVWRQKRCDEVIAEHHAFIERQRANGRASAAQRALNGRSTTVEPPLNECTNQTSTATSVVVQPPTPTPTPTPKKSRRTSHKFPLPDDFTLTPDLARYAAALLPDANVAEMFDGFRGKALAKGWKYANWNQAWQEFVRNARKDSGHFASGVYPKLEVGKWM